MKLLMTRLLLVVFDYSIVFYHVPGTAVATRHREIYTSDNHMLFVRTVSLLHNAPKRGPRLVLA